MLLSISVQMPTGAIFQFRSGKCKYTFTRATRQTIEITMTPYLIKVSIPETKQVHIHSQATNYKDTCKCKLLGSGLIESPNVRQRQHHECYIHQNIENCIVKKEIIIINSAFDRLVPVSKAQDRSTLENCNHNLMHLIQ